MTMVTSSKQINYFQEGSIHNNLIGCLEFNCWLVIKDASKSNSISGSLRMILDETKAYDCIYPEYLCRALKWFVFSNKFIKCICDFSLNICGEIGPSWLVCTPKSVTFPLSDRSIFSNQELKELTTDDSTLNL